MSLLGPFATPFWSHFWSQVPNYTPLWGARVRFLRFVCVCFQSRFFNDFWLDSVGTPPPPQRVMEGRVRAPVFFNISALNRANTMCLSTFPVVWISGAP